METKFNFNSAVCTSRSQSERLLALGLKKETADIEICCLNGEIRFLEDENYKDTGITIPAWSLHRLWEIGKFMGINLSSEVAISHLYEFAIARIEQQIKKGYFNKEYLEE